MKNKSRINKYLLKDEIVVYKPQMTPAAGIPHLLFVIFSFLVIAFLTYWFICLCVDEQAVYELSQKLLAEDNFTLLEKLDSSNEKFSFISPSTLFFLIKCKCLEFEWERASMLIPIIPLLIFSIRELMWAIRGFTREAVITNRRIILFDTALIHDYFFDFKLERVTEVVGKKGLIGKIFHYGEIFIGTGNQTVGLPGYKNYLQTLNTIEEIVEKAQNDKNHQ